MDPLIFRAAVAVILALIIFLIARRAFAHWQARLERKRIAEIERQEEWDRARRRRIESLDEIPY